MTMLPGTFKREQVVAAFDALGLDGDDISSVEITGTQIEVGLFIFDEEDRMIRRHGECAQIFVTIPIEEPA